MSGLSQVSSAMILLLKKMDNSTYASLRENEAEIKRISDMCKIMPEYITVKKHNGEYKDKTALDCWRILINEVINSVSSLETYYSTLRLLPIVSAKLESEPKLISDN